MSGNELITEGLLGGGVALVTAGLLSESVAVTATRRVKVRSPLLLIEKVTANITVERR